MNPIAMALNHVRFTIPREVLDAVFIERNRFLRQVPMTVDAHITNEVIRARVLPELNLVGGAEIFVALQGIPGERINQFTSVYKIPKSRTGGRTIITVLNVTFSDPTATSNYGTATGCQSTEMLVTGQAMIDAMGTIPITSTAHVQLVGENTVMVRDTILLPPNVYLRCIVENDSNLSHLQARSYRAFFKLVEFAVKSFIYNNYIIQMDVGELYGGHNLGRFKEVVDSYSDAEELYQTHMREVMAKVMMMNDTEQHGRFLRMLVGGRR
jgi:hypothetical protein